MGNCQQLMFFPNRPGQDWSQVSWGAERMRMMDQDHHRQFVVIAHDWG
jgi:hypothetical protein